MGVNAEVPVYVLGNIDVFVVRFIVMSTLNLFQSVRKREEMHIIFFVF